MNKSFNEHVREALHDVESGQHLRFIAELFRTKEVCLAAVKYESTHNKYMSHDIHAVLMPHLNYVMENMRDIRKDDPYYLGELEKDYNKIKEKGQELMDKYEGVDYDVLLRNKYNSDMRKNSEISQEKSIGKQ